MNTRTDEQSFADSFDLQLFNLMESAETFGCDGDTDWKEVAQRIRQARGIVRQRMHPDDRELTRNGL